MVYFGLSAVSAYCHSVGVLSMTTDFIGSLVFGGLDFFTRRYFAFEKEVLSAVSRLYLGRFKPNWLKFWSAWLASWIAILWKNQVTYLKNRVSVVFPVVRETGNLWRPMPVGRCEYKSTYWCLHVEDWYEGPFDWCRYLPTCSSEQVLSKTSKKVQQTCVGRFKPNLAQILAKGPPG